MSHRFHAVCIAVSLLFAAALPAAAQEEADPDAPKVERIDVVRNQFLDKETFLFYISTKPGDRYDEKRLRDDFRRVWDTGFVEDLLLDVRDGAKGKIVTFVVDERRRPVGLLDIQDLLAIRALSSAP